MSSDAETIAIYNAKADDYARMLEKSAPDLQLMDFMQAVTPGGVVLDLGAGPGSAAGSLAANGFNVEAWDVSESMLQLAGRHAGVTIRQAGFDDLTATAAFDGIWANFSLLHAKRQAFTGHLNAIHTALRPGGAFHIGMKIGSGSERDSLGRFYTYYDQVELTGLLTTAGFSVDKTTLGRGSGLSGDVSPWITLLTYA